MKVLKFKRERDLVPLMLMLSARQVPLSVGQDLPKVGYVVYNAQGLVIGAAFLRRVEGGFGQIDGLVTNPNASSKNRHEAINKIVDKLIRKGKALKLKHLYAFSIDKSTIQRALACGFNELPHKVYALSLISGAQ